MPIDNESEERLESNDVGKTNVLVVNNNSYSNEEICKILTTELGVHDQDIEIVARASEALSILKEVKETRKKIHILILQEKISGKQFVKFINENILGEETIPCIITNETIMENEAPPSQKTESDSQSPLARIQTLLEQKPDFLKEILNELNVLIINESEENRHRIKSMLEKEGVPVENISESSTQEDGLDLLIEGVKREFHLEGDIKEKREKIYTLIMDAKKGPAFAELVQNSGLVYPYIVVLNHNEQKPDDSVLSNAASNSPLVKNTEANKLWDPAKLDLKNIVFLEDTELDSEIIDQIAHYSNLHIKAQELKQAEEGSKKMDGRRDSKSQELMPIVPKEEKAREDDAPKEKLIITPNDDEFFCFYEQYNSLPTLRRFTQDELVKYGNPVIKKPLKGKNAALFDVDGTLAKPFIMGRFAKELRKNENLKNLMLHLPAKERRVHSNSLNELLNLIEFIEMSDVERGANERKRQFKIYKDDGYEILLNKMNSLYAKVLAGLKVREVCKLGYKFSKEDFKLHKYKYAVPVVHLVKFLGLEPSLVTGMPAEMIGGYRESLDIKERCYPMTLHTTGSGSDMVYDENVIYGGGFGTDKVDTASEITANGNDIYMFMGDQKSDMSAMAYTIATLKQKTGAYGKGFFMMDILSHEGRKLYTDIRGANQKFVLGRHLVPIERGFKEFAILRMIVQELHSMAVIMDGFRGSQDKNDIFRNRLDYITNHFMEAILSHYKDESDDPTSQLALFENGNSDPTSKD